MTSTVRPTPKRWQPLRATAIVAAVFVVGRVLFRVVFGGADAGGSALPSIPRMTLPDPIASVTLFGPVTTGGLAQAVWGALPFALFIVGTGLLFSVIDLRRVLVRTRRWGGGTATLGALLVALATIPEVAATLTRIRRTLRLRQDRTSSVVIAGAVLGASVERATSLAASLDARGFAASSREAEPDCATPIALDDVTLTLPSGRTVVRGMSFSLTPGSFTVLSGATGSGKTSILRALVGLFDTFDHGRVSGHIRVGGVDRAGLPARATAGFVSYVAQDVRAGFIGTTVAEEIGLSLTLRGEPRGTVDVIVDEMARNVGATHLLDRTIESLSAGEATLVALAGALVSRPAVLLLDEPLADLDAESTARVVNVLEQLTHETGITVLVAEHDVSPLGAIATGYVHITEQSVIETESALVPDREARQERVEKSQSDIVAITGPNGSGKTTLLWRWALPGRRSALGVRLVPDNPLDLLAHLTVAEELRTSQSRAMLSRLVRDSVPVGAHPRDLSTGQQRALAIAIQLADRPDVLLVDEPTRGLDPHARDELADILLRVSAEGTRVIVATHDRDFVTRLGARDVAIGDVAQTAEAVLA